VVMKRSDFSGGHVRNTSQSDWMSNHLISFKRANTHLGAYAIKSDYLIYGKAHFFQVFL